MPINITMPALSPTMEEGNLAKWLVKEGDKVSAGDVIAEIETDKATMEVEAVDEGTVAKIVVPAGTEGVKVNALIAILAAEGEDAGAAAKSGDGAAKAEAKPEKALVSPPVGEMSPKATEGGAVPPASQPKEAKNGANGALRCPPLACRPSPPQGGDQPRRAHLRLAARPAHRQGCRRRRLGRCRLRPAWPRRQGRCRGGDRWRRREGRACRETAPGAAPAAGAAPAPKAMSDEQC